MTTALKIVNAALILFTVYMGVKQGWAMLSGKPVMLEMFEKWNISKTGMMVIGVFTILSALLVLFPQTFLAGNFITAAVILLIMMLHLQHRDIKGFMIELPFFLLPLIIVYLRYPLKKV
ncbi:MAG TPA: hypothetical protein VIN08_01565 [Ohtaekwangia sp.]|uniref:hypothetical protein n=1 Tax=Ohtaekwangia sp. TaxID=2066019 RepID=UPI002F93A231